MKRHLLLLAPLLLAACSSNGTLGVDINSDDRESGVQALAASVDLATVASVTITVDEIWAHVSDDDGKTEDVNGDAVTDDDGGWQLVSEADQAIDLMAVRNDVTGTLGTLELPAGKLTQVRLKLKATGDAGSDKRLAAAVVGADGNACDLIVPRSAVEPGLKIIGLFKAMRIEAGGTHHVVLNFKLKELKREEGGGCVYRLNPVLKVKAFHEHVEEGGEDGGGDEGDVLN